MICKFCKCDDNHACAGGCSWHKAEYCSACREQHMDQLCAVVLAWIAPDVAAPVLLGGRPAAIIEEPDNLIVMDHIGAIALRFDEDGVYLAPQYEAPELIELFVEHRRAA